jgi:periplasmic copper chaperone A
MNHRLLSAAALALLTPLWTLTALADPLTVSGAWVREGPPTTAVLAAYMQIDNTSAQDQTLVGASSPQFETVEIHRTEIVDGVARMLQQERLVIPAGGGVTLEPGGLHLMLIQSQQPLAQGDQVTIRLRLDDGTEIPVDAEVRKAEAEGMDHDHDHHNHHH